MRSKKLDGLSQNDTTSADMIGHSSGLVMWWMPKTYQTTTSVFVVGRFASVHSGSPWSTRLWLTNSPEGQRSSGAFGVTHTVWSITRERCSTGASGWNIDGIAPPGTSLYDTGVPRPLRELSFVTFQARWVFQL